MNDESVQLLWDALQSNEGDIPWSAMGTFADALAAEPGLIDSLLNAYDEAREAVHERACYVHLYVPAIFAMAAPKLNDRQRQEIGESLIARLVEAGEQDDHLMTEVLVAACGAMGPVILPLVFGVVIDEAASSDAWDHLWGLTKLAVGSDATLRDKVVAACVSLLDRVGRDEVECERGVEAAWTLASLGQAEHVDLLKRLERQSRWTLAYIDYSGARRALEEQRNSPLPQELWELPVRDWFEPRWQRTRDWLVMRDCGTRNWEALQATYAAEPFAAKIPIVEQSPKSGRKDSRCTAIR
ncbi:MAG: hypothetical protein ACM3VT_13490 [Solirubrobacterales bacterium]